MTSTTFLEQNVFAFGKITQHDHDGNNIHSSVVNSLNTQSK